MQAWQLSRRQFVAQQRRQWSQQRAAAPIVATSQPAALVPSTWPPHPPRAVASEDPIVHLLQRITWGPTPDELARAQDIGYEAYLDEQLHPESIDDSAVEDALPGLFPTLSMTPAELYVIGEEDFGVPPGQLQQAMLYRAVHSRRQLFEVIVDFWTNHFNIYHLVDDCYVLKTIDDRDVIRRFALGRFGDLLQASAASPAMIIYLDNFNNTSSGPNANYAREVMELHTLGVDGGYTQADVGEVARCFTGWSLVWGGRQRGAFRFYAGDHDTAAKTVLGVKIPAGGGLADGRRVLRLLAEHESTAHFLALKLCRRFVADQPPQSILDSTAAIFRDTDGDIKATLRHILTSTEFLAAVGQKLRRPLDYIVAGLRMLPVDVPATAYEGLIYSFLMPLGQVPFDCHPPNGYPDVAGPWVSSNGLLGRWTFASVLLNGWLQDSGVTLQFDTWLNELSARTPDALVTLLLERLIQRPINASDRQVFISYVAGARPPDRPVSMAFLQRRAPGLASLIISSPHFQWR